MIANNFKDDYEIDRPQSWIDIDFSVDAHSSVVHTVVIFLFFMCALLVYSALITLIPALQPKCGDTFGCRLAGAVITWLIFAVVLSVTGYLVVNPLSMGNNPTEWSAFHHFLAFICSLVIK